MSRTGFETTPTAAPATSLLVALDGSLFAERAVAPACSLAARLGIGVQLWSAAPSPAEAEARRSRLQALAATCGADWDVVVTDQPIEAIPAAAAGDGHPLVCLATHGRDRTAGLAHSVSAAVVAASHGPVMLVGPDIAAERPSAGGVAVCVDGTPESEVVVPIALAWAAALRVGVHILTVAEPVPESVRLPGHYPRLHGPQGDADAYMETLTSTWSGDVAVTGQVIYDPVDVDGALAQALADAAPDLVVMGTRSARGLRRLIFGSTAAALAHRSPAPVLVVPL
jgi:nucleotide-binding universal stress UspA family protein